MTAISEAATELALFAVNDGTLYEGRVTDIIKNLSRHLIAGDYKAENAKKSWRTFADEAAKSYAKTHAKLSQWNTIFTVADRESAAIYFTEYYENMVEFEANTAVCAEHVLVKIYDYSRDVNGNPTAKHIAMDCNADGQIEPEALKAKPHRTQTGTGDYLDGVGSAFKKAKINILAYERVSIKGSRADGETLVRFMHKPITIADGEKVSS